MATLGRPTLTTSASRAGRASRSMSSSFAACISGVAASTAAEYTKRSMPRWTAEPSWGRVAMPSSRRRTASSWFLPRSKERSDPWTVWPQARMSRARGFMPAPAMPEKWERSDSPWTLTGRRPCTGDANFARPPGLDFPGRWRCRFAVRRRPLVRVSPSPRRLGTSYEPGSRARLRAHHADERHALAGRTAQVVREGQAATPGDARDLPRAGLTAKLQPALEQHAEAGRSDRMPEGLEAAVRVDRQLTIQVEGAGQHLLPRGAPRGEAEILHEDQLGRREAVVHLGHGQLLARILHAGLGVGVSRRGHDLGEGGVVVVGIHRPGGRAGDEGE